jgi:hypothetical protein
MLSITPSEGILVETLKEDRVGEGVNNCLGKVTSDFLLYSHISGLAL